MTRCAEEDMEAYRLLNQRSFDPMAAFLGGGDEVSAETRRVSFSCDFLIDFNADIRHANGKQGRHCHAFSAGDRGSDRARSGG